MTAPKLKITIKLEIPQISLALINEAPEIPPLLRVGIYKFKVAGAFPDGLTVDLAMESSYYNMYRCSWDPLIENWPVHVSFSAVDDTKIEVTADQILKLSATAELLNALTVWTKDFDQSSNSYSAVVMRNFTSSPATYYLSSTGKKVPYTIAPGEQKAVDVGDIHSLKQISILSLSLEGIGKLTNLDLFKEKTKITQFPKDTLIYQVKFSQSTGQRIITLGSTIRLFNETSQSIFVRFQAKGLPEFVLSVEPEKDISPPTEYAHGLVSFRPNEKSEWSTSINCADINDTKYSVSLKDQNKKPFYYSLVVDVSEPLHGPIFTFKIAPPLTLENLLPVTMTYEIESIEGTSKLTKAKDVHIHGVSNDGPIKLKLSIPGFTSPKSVDINHPEQQLIEVQDVDER